MKFIIYGVRIENYEKRIECSHSISEEIQKKITQLKAKVKEIRM